MIRTRSKKVILVAPEVFPEQLVRSYSRVKQVSALGSLFPAIFDFNPDLIILDHDFIGPSDTERTVRRIRSNRFYDKIRVACFKTDRSEKTDSLLKVLGVDELIYAEDLIKPKKTGNILNSVNAMLDHSIIALAASVSN